LARLSDEELLTEAGQAAGDERGAMARLVATLVEVDKRRLYRDAGCSSLFSFCTQVLRLSESEAYLRMEAARAARKFPLILERLADASVTLTTVSLLAKHLSEDNHRALLGEVRHRSKRDVEAIVARISPRPDAVSIVRTLPVACAAQTSATAKVPADARADGRDALDARSTGVDTVERVATVRIAARRMVKQDEPSICAATGGAAADGDVSRPALRSGPRSDVTQLSSNRYRVQVTIGAETHEKLRRAQDLLRHVVPNGDLEEVFDRAVALLLAELEKTRLGATSRPRLPRLPGEDAKAPSRKAGPQDASASGTAKESRHGERPKAGSPARPAQPGARTGTSRQRRSRHIPAAVKREVVQRDGLRCTFVGSEGRCRETGMLEFHHHDPFAAGGAHTASNVTIACVHHNALEAERFYGRSGVRSLDSTDRNATAERPDNGAVNSVQTQCESAPPADGP
jgi:hypothetical protein